MARINGNDRDNSIGGSNSSDKIYAKNGNDYVDAKGGNDYVDGGNGDDWLDGGDGNDTLKGGSGKDVLIGGAGSDRVYGGDGDDILLGDEVPGHGSGSGSGSRGRRGSGSGSRGRGSDCGSGSGSGDVSFNDYLDGGSGNDIILGQLGNDTLKGGSGNDYLDGGVGTDSVDGEDGHDTGVFVVGENGGGTDWYDGGKGCDTLVVSMTSAQFNNPGIRSDLQALQAFIEANANAWTDNGDKLTLSNLGLKVQDWESVKFFVDGEEVELALDPLFTQNPDGVDFDDVEAGTYLDGTQYDALESDDVVSLASSEAEAAQAGYDTSRMFSAGAGDDTVTGRGLDDTIEGNEGDDTLDGGAGDDTIYGDNSDDTGTPGATYFASGNAAAWAGAGVTLSALDFGGSAGTVTYDGDGVGVSGGNPVGNQINHSSDGTSETLVAQFDDPATEATVTVSRMYATESGGEQGAWAAYDASGNLVGQGTFGPEITGGGNVGSFTISGIGEFSEIRFTGREYANGTAPGANDSSDYYVKSIAYTTAGSEPTDGGDDVIVGGTGDDTLYGQGGNDIIDGDAPSGITIRTVENNDGCFDIGGACEITISVDYLSSFAGYNNSFGYYLAGSDGVPTSGSVIFANVKTGGDGVGDVVTITLDANDLSGGEKLGFFIIPNGSDKNAGLSDGDDVTFAGSGGSWQVLKDGTPLDGQGADVLFSNEDLNPGSYDHEEDASPEGNMNWEDIVHGGDRDYNDANFNVKVEGAFFGSGMVYEEPAHASGSGTAHASGSASGSGYHHGSGSASGSGKRGSGSASGKHKGKGSGSGSGKRGSGSASGSGYAHGSGSASGRGSGSGSGSGTGAHNGSGTAETVSFNDYLDGGAGDDILDGNLGADIVYGNDGNDIGEFIVGEYGGLDQYDGGTGTDTLRIFLTSEQYNDPAFQAEISALRAFIEANSDATTDSGATMTFSLLDLQVQDWEELEIYVDGKPLNNPIDAVNDAATAAEDGPAVNIDVLANDSAPDGLASIALVAGPSSGTATVNPDNTITFDPAGDFDYLAEGETTTVTFTYEIEDTDGDTDTATVTVTVTGTNDDPIITVVPGNGDSVDGDVKELADGAAGENTADLTSEGSITFDDADLSDGHTISLSANGAGYIGTFNATIATSATGAGAGSIDWTFEVNDGLLDSLNEGETLTQSYDVTVDDGNGGTAVQTVTITIEGTNDAPVVQDVTVTGVIEDGAAVTDSFVGDDVDDEDDGSTLTYTVTSAPSEGSVVNNGDGTFTFDPEDDFQDLAEGETRQVTFDYTATDAQGAVSNTGTVTVTVTGTNDDPIITVVPGNGDSVDGDVKELADGAAGENTADLTAEGSITFDDADLSDGHTISSSANGAGYIGTFNATIATSATGAGEGSIDWTFEVNDGLLDSLNEGETLTQSYDVTVDDGNGGTAVQTVTITIEGTNDAPVVQDVTVTGVIEDGAAVTDSFVGDDVDDEDDGSTLTYTVTSAPSEGSVVNNGDGTFTFDPEDDFQDLAEGETRQVTFDYTATDAQGAVSNTGTVTVTVTGTNDDPHVIVSGTDDSGDVKEITDGAPGENTADLTADGTILFDDVDLSDGHTVNASANGGGYIGSFDVVLSDTATGASNGAVDWEFTVNDGLLDTLNEGETIVQSYDVTITDENGGSVVQTVTITIEGTNDRPVVQDVTVTGAIEGGSTVTDSFVGDDVDDEDDGSTLTYSIASQPSEGSVVNNGDGTFTFDPEDDFQDLAEGQTRDVTFTYTATDAQGGVSNTGTVTVTVTGTNDDPYVVLTGTDDEGFVKEITDGLPAENTADLSTDGLIEFDDEDLIDGHTVTTSANGTGYLGTFTASVVDPATGASTGAVEWEFTVNDSLLDSLNAGEQIVQSYDVTIDDGNGGTATQTVEITIEGTNDRPVVQNVTVSGVIEDGATVTDSFVGDDVDTEDDGSTLNYTITSQPSEGSVANNGNGTFTFDPEDDFQYLAEGETRDVTFTYTATDAQGTISNTATVTVTVTGTNDDPIITVVPGNGDSVDGDVKELADGAPGENSSDLTAEGSITFDDADLSDGHTISSSANGTGYIGTFAVAIAATATGAGAGSIDWTFEVNDGLLDSLNEGETLTQSYDVTIDDGNGGSATQTVTITIEGTNDAPVVQDVTVTGVIEDGAPVTDSFVGDDVDDEDNISTLTYDITSTPSEGSVVNNNDGTFTFDPQDDFQDLAQGETRDVTFDYTATDAQGAVSNTGTVTVTITGENDDPNAFDDLFTTTEDIVLAGNVLDDNGNGADSDVDNGDTITVIAGTYTTAEGGTVTINSDGSFSYTPFEHFSGSDSFEYTIEDSQGAQDTATANITVIPDADMPNITVVEPARGNPGQPIPLDITIDFPDQDGSEIHTITICDVPKGATLNNGTKNPDGSWSLTPADLAGLTITTGVAEPVFEANFDLKDLLASNGNDGSLGFIINGIGNLEAGATTSDATGYDVSSAGDINGDGIDDVIVSAILGEGAFPNAQNQGEVYVIFGTDQGFDPEFEVYDLLASQGGDGSKGFILRGIDNDDRMGVNVRSAGDVNGDGIDDIITGSFKANPNGENDAGQAYIIFGSNTGFAPEISVGSLNGTNGYKINGDPLFSSTSNDFTGYALGGGYDMDGDGIDDVLIGARGNDPTLGVNDNGSTYLVLGGASRLAALDAADGLTDGEINLEEFVVDGVNIFEFEGVDPGDHSSVSISGTGDLNGDGIADILIGARHGDPNGNNNAGEVYVVFGGLENLQAFDQVGQVAPLPGDPLLPPDGQIQLANIDGTYGYVFEGVGANDKAGRSVSDAGDLNGDGLSDIIIGAYSANNGAGEAYVVFGGLGNFQSMDAEDGIIDGRIDLAELFAANGGDGSAGFIITAENAGDRLGQNVRNAGDVNGDGFDDLIIGAPNADPNGVGNAGSTYIIFGSGTGFGAELNLDDIRNGDGSQGFALNGIDAFDLSGWSASGAGDVNGDGIDDIIIGAYGADPHGSVSGEAYVVFGREGLSVEDFTLKIKATATEQANGDSETAMDTLFVDLNEAPDAENETLSIDENTPNGTYVTTAIATDPDTGDTLDYAIIGGSGVGVFDIDTVTGDITVIDASQLDYETQQTFTLIVEVTDDFGLTDTGVITINLNDVFENQFVDAIDDTASTTEGGPAVVIDVTANDDVPDGISSVTIVTGPSEGSASVNPDNTISFDPGSDFDDLAEGETRVVTFTYEVEDPQGDTDTATVTVTVTGTNDDPIITVVPGNGDSVDGDVKELADGAAGENTADLTAEGSITFDDADLSDGHTVSSTASGTGYIGTFSAVIVTAATGAGEGSIDWTFEVNDGLLDSLNEGETIVQSYDVTVDDGNGGTATQTITITIEGTNDAPVVQDVTVTGVEEDGAAVTDSFDGDDVDNEDDGSTLTYTITSSPSEGSVVNNNDGTFTFDPEDDFQDLAPGQTRDVTFDYTATDAQGAVSNTGTVTVTVTGTNDAPVVQDIALNAVEDGPAVSDSFVGDDPDSDDDGSTLNYLITSAPAEGSVVNNNDGTFTFDPGTDFQDLAEGETRQVTFTYDASDSHGADSNTGTVTVTVTGTNDDPIITVVPGNGDSVDGDVKELADGAAGENTADLTAEGSITFDDADLSDGHTISSSANGAGYIGTFNATIATSATGAGAGSIDWTFEVNDGLLDSLNEGETLTQSYDVTVDDGNGGTVTQTVTITIEGTNDAPVISGVASGEVTEDASPNTVSGQLDGTDVDIGATETWTVVGGGAGTYGTLTVDGTGQWTYTLDNSTPALEDLDTGETATETFTVELTDDNGASDTQTVTITINGNTDNELVLAVDDTGSASEDGPAVDIDVLANDTFPDGFGSVTITAQPSGGVATVNPDNTIRFDPNGDFEELALGETTQVTIEYELEDADGDTDTATITVTVTGTNDDPIITFAGTNDEGAVTEISDGAPGENVIQLETAGQFDLDDPDVSDTHTLSTEAQGTGYLGTFNASIDLPATGILSGIVTWQFTVNDSDVDFMAAGETLVQSYDVTVDDGNGGTATETVTITIEGTNDAPVITGGDTSASITELSDGEPGENSIDHVETGSLAFIDVDVTDTHTASAAADGTGYVGTMSAVVNGGAVDWTFTVNDADIDNLAPGQVLVQTYTVTVDDGNGGTDSETVTIEITGTNSAPVVQDITNAVSEDGPVLVDLFEGDDADTDDDQSTLNYMLTSTPALGILVNNGDGTFSYDPNGQFETLKNGETEEVTFTYTATDQHGAVSNTGTVTITVNGVNDDPTGGDDLFNGIEDIQLIGNVLADNGNGADSDVEGDSLSVVETSITTNEGGSVTMSSNGDFTYTPAAHFSGADTFTYTLSDGNGGTDTVTATINVEAVADAPTFTTSVATATVGLDPVTIAVPVSVDFPDQDGSETQTVTFTDVPPEVSFSAGTQNPDGSWTFTAAEMAGLEMTLDGSPVFGPFVDLFELDEAFGGDGSKGFILNGGRGGIASGFDVASAGDVNGDGFADVLTGAILADPDGVTNAGSVFLYFGGASHSAETNLQNLTPAQGYRFDGVEIDDATGVSVRGVGDVNNDGYDDFMIGAPRANVHGDRDGRAYVIFGSENNTNLADLDDDDGTTDGVIKLANLLAVNGGDGSKGFVLNGAAETPSTSNDDGGYSLGGGIDFNGDGVDDMFFGARGNDWFIDGNNNGSKEGHETKIDIGATFIVFGKTSGYSAEFDLRDLMDANGDTAVDPVGGGIFGSQGIGDGSEGIVLRGIDTSDLSGYQIAGIQDMTGDGKDEILIGARQADPNGGNSGEAYLVFGFDTTGTPELALESLNGTNGFIFNGISAGDKFGRAVGDAGDLNGDGITDLVFGAYDADMDGNNSGAAYVVFGGMSNLSDLDDDDGVADGTIEMSQLLTGDGSKGFVIRGDAAGDNAGWYTRGAGDINGDGFQDVIIGSPRSEAGTSGGALKGDAGETYIIFGTENGFAPVIDLSDLEIGTGEVGFVFRGVDSSDKSGWSVNAAGDVNGDGIDDVIIGSYAAGAAQGETYVVYGKQQLGANDFVIAIQGDATENSNGDNAQGFGDLYVDVDGDPNNNAVTASPANQSINGTPGNDVLDGGAGNDTIFGGDGDDIINGGDGDDHLFGGPGNDTIFGDAGNDTIEGGPGPDSLDGGDGIDTLSFANANTGITADIVFHGAGGDASGDNYYNFENIIGSEFDDTLVGDAEDNYIFGGAGNDLIGGREGNDTLNGGAGNDTFLANTGDEMFIFENGTGDDAIQNFVTGASSDDVADVTAFGFVDFNDLLDVSTDVGSDVVIALDGDDSLTLIGVQKADLHEDDFLI